MMSSARRTTRLRSTRRVTTPEESRSQQAESRLTACRFARLAEDLRGQNTVVLDLTGTTPIVDFFVITTGSSPRQMRAVADEIKKTLKSTGQTVISSEGEDSGAWILNDFGDIVLHVFSGESRRLYDLENLWADAKRVDWAAELAAAGESRTQ